MKFFACPDVPVCFVSKRDWNSIGVALPFFLIFPIVAFLGSEECRETCARL